LFDLMIIKQYNTAIENKKNFPSALDSDKSMRWALETEHEQ